MKALREKLDRMARLVDGIGMQLYFASGAFTEKQDKSGVKLTHTQMQRFWSEASRLLAKL